MITIALTVLALLFTALTVMAWIYNRLMWRRARAHQWWNHVDSCRYARHDIVRELLDMSHLPLQHAINQVADLEKALTRAQIASGMELVLQAEMNLTDAIVDLENTIDLKPPRYDAGRIFQQIKKLDGGDRKLDDARRAYNESAAILNRSLRHPFGRIVGGLFRVLPLPYFHHSRDDQDLPPEAEALAGPADTAPEPMEQTIETPDSGPQGKSK